MLIGTDPYLFEFQDVFLQLPANIKLGYTHGVCVDTADNVYVFNQGQSAVLIFDRFGQYQRSWGEEYAHGAHGMRLTDEEYSQFLYLTDYERHSVTKTTLRGLRQLRLGMPPNRDAYAAPSEFKPTDCCVAPDGTIFVADGYGKPYVHAYGRKGKFLFSIGGPGTAEGKFNCPHGIWVDTRRPEPELYVADRGNARIQVFSLDGKYRRTIKHEVMTMPSGFYQYGHDLYVADLHAKVVVLDAKDQVAAVLGADPDAPGRPGWPNTPDQLQPGKFSSPHALAIDTHGDVYVAEWISTGRVTKLVRKSPPPDNMQPQRGRYT
jgi:sugar lactone lactonase YvrE